MHLDAKGLAEMEKIPMEWVDKLFLCLKEFYGEKFSFKDEKTESLAKVVWQSALVGLSYDEIKRALIFCKWQAKHRPSITPPHQMEFFRYAKEVQQFEAKSPQKEERCDPEVAKAHLAQIRQSLNPKVSCRTNG